MIHFAYDPPLSARLASGPFAQKIHLLDDTQVIGRADWYATQDSAGVTQLLHLWIDPALRRSGHGRRLLHGLIEQTRSYHRMRNENLRRIWVGVGHKEQVIGRSFLTREGFHHIGSACGVLRDQDLLIYLKSFD